MNTQSALTATVGEATEAKKEAPGQSILELRYVIHVFYSIAVQPKAGLLPSAECLDFDRDELFFSSSQKSLKIRMS